MLQDTGHVIKAQERVDAYYSGKEQIVATLTQIANHLHNPPPAERKDPEQIIAHDITKLKQVHMKLREMSDILVQAIALVCPGRETLYVDPSGSDYGRYVGRAVISDKSDSAT